MTLATCRAVAASDRGWPRVSSPAADSAWASNDLRFALNIQSPLGSKVASLPYANAGRAGHALVPQ